MRVIAIAIVAVLMVAAASALTEPDRMHVKVKDNIEKLNINKEKMPDSAFAIADDEGGHFGWGGYGGFGYGGLGYGIGYPLYGYGYYPYYSGLYGW